MQMHAVGCYTVVHSLKTSMRRAENAAVQAGALVEKWPADAGKDAPKRLDEAWRHILFNQFHDILAGSSIEPAYEDSRDQLGLATAVATDVIVAATRRQAARMEPAPAQRLVLTNLSRRAFDGYVEFEPWLGARTDQAIRLQDADGYDVPCQRVATEAAVANLTRLLFPASVPALSRATIEIHHDRSDSTPPGVCLAGDVLSNTKVGCRLGPDGVTSIRLGETEEYLGEAGIRLAAFEDPTDTWSHGIRGYDGRMVGEFLEETPWRAYEEGPLRIAMAKTLRLGDSSLLWRVILQAGEPIVRMRLTIHWKGEHQVVKMLVPTGLAGRRLDGCPGGDILRPFSADECPFHDYTALSEGADGGGRTLAVVTADAFGLDVREGGLARLTLLRSPAYAHHEPYELPEPSFFPVTDQGIHQYEIALMPMRPLSMDDVYDEANRQASPLWIAETTRGMENR